LNAASDVLNNAGLKGLSAGQYSAHLHQTSFHVFFMKNLIVLYIGKVKIIAY
jgi:hypothetical protein